VNTFFPEPSVGDDWQCERVQPGRAPTDRPTPNRREIPRAADAAGHDVNPHLQAEPDGRSEVRLHAQLRGLAYGQRRSLPRTAMGYSGVNVAGIPQTTDCPRSFGRVYRPGRHRVPARVRVRQQLPVPGRRRLFAG